MPKPSVPESWLAVMISLDAAEVALRTIADPAVPASARGAAEASFQRAAETIVAELGLMKRRGQLEAVSRALKAAHEA